MEHIRNILAVAGEDEKACRAIDRGADLARASGARLTLVGTAYGLPSFAKALVARGDDIAALAARERRERLEARAAAIREQGVVVEAIVLRDPQPRDLVAEAVASSYDLVIKVAELEGGLKRLLFGSFDMALLRHCPCPVWLLHPEAPERSFERVLVAVDPAPDDEVRTALNAKLLEMGQAVAKAEDAALDVVYVRSVFGEGILRSHLTEEQVHDYLRACEVEAARVLDDLLVPFGMTSSQPRVHLLKGDPGHQIARLAEVAGVDLLVMGTVARAGLSAFLIGNTAEKVLRQVECSVLAVKPDGFVSPVGAAAASRTA